MQILSVEKRVRSRSGASDRTTQPVFLYPLHATFTVVIVEGLFSVTKCPCDKVLSEAINVFYKNAEKVGRLDKYKI